MKVRVLFFGATADEAGTRSREMEISNASARGVVDEILRDTPRLARHKLHFSINQQYVSEDTLVSDGDEVAIFTAVSGG